jgi:hypothetical protein
MQDYVKQGALGSMIQLPLGKKTDSKETSTFLYDNHSMVALENLPMFFHNIQKITPDAILRAIQLLEQTAKSIQEIDQNILLLIEKCSVLNYLFKQANQKHDLKHIERLVMLYSIGTMGIKGSTALHSILMQCTNYNKRITSRWISKLDPSFHPISCVKIRDWLNYITPQVSCNCSFKLKRLSTHLQFTMLKNFISRQDRFKQIKTLKTPIKS